VIMVDNLKIDVNTGLIEGVRFVCSPNCDARAPESEVDVLVIHAISMPPGRFGGPDVERLFSNALDFDSDPFYREIEGLRVSAHVLIRRDGEIVQFVPLQARAWHAGESCCEGRTRVNDFSIGIELEGCDELPFEAVQYQVLSEVTRAIMRAYPAITPARIFGHSDIAHGRKTDPGPCFDWERYRRALD
jgi:AmpD protein